MAFPDFQILPYILHRLIFHLNEPTWAQGPTAAECSAEPGWLQLEAATSCHQNPLYRSPSKVCHFCTALISYWVPTPHTALQTDLNSPGFCTEAMQQHPAHGFYWEHTKNPAVRTPIGAFFFFILWLHLNLRLCRIFMPLPAASSHWDFA